jgi:hypothetical protein
VKADRDEQPKQKDRQRQDVNEPSDDRTMTRLGMRAAHSDFTKQ